MLLLFRQKLFQPLMVWQIKVIYAFLNFFIIRKHLIHLVVLGSMGVDKIRLIRISFSDPVPVHINHIPIPRIYQDCILLLPQKIIKVRQIPVTVWQNQIFFQF